MITFEQNNESKKEPVTVETINWKEYRDKPFMGVYLFTDRCSGPYGKDQHYFTTSEGSQIKRVKIHGGWFIDSFLREKEIMRGDTVKIIFLGKKSIDGNGRSVNLFTAEILERVKA